MLSSNVGAHSPSVRITADPDSGSYPIANRLNRRTRGRLTATRSAGDRLPLDQPSVVAAVERPIVAAFPKTTGKRPCKK